VVVTKIGTLSIEGMDGYVFFVSTSMLVVWLTEGLVSNQIQNN
jgi:hypothetical protein